MSESITDQQAEKAKVFIRDVLEPKIEQLIKTANEILNKHGIMVGVSAQWYIDKSETNKEGDKND